jgi:hypothetical protein
MESHIDWHRKGAAKTSAAAADMREELAALYLKLDICGHGGFYCQTSCVNN